MSQYLTEAAALLRKAAEKNEREYAGQYSGKALIDGRERIAMKFAQLAAIDRGLIPPDMVADLLTAIVRTS